jgi:hypothetical protein
MADADTELTLGAASCGGLADREVVDAADA